jgi:pullulanase/glycogen debranching enzyme
MTTMLEPEQTPIRADAVEGSTGQGASSPLGATPCDGGVNFSLFSKHATGVELLLFDRVDDANAARVFRIETLCHATSQMLMCGIFVCQTTLGSKTAASRWKQENLSANWDRCLGHGSVYLENTQRLHA